MDNEIMVGNPTTTLELSSASRRYNGRIVKCEVNNIIGKSEETETLNVHCKYYISKSNTCPEKTMVFLIFQMNQNLWSNLQILVGKRVKM